MDTEPVSRSLMTGSAVPVGAGIVSRTAASEGIDSGRTQATKRIGVSVRNAYSKR